MDNVLQYRPMYSSSPYGWQACTASVESTACLHLCPVVLMLQLHSHQLTVHPGFIHCDDWAGDSCGCTRYPASSSSQPAHGNIVLRFMFKLDWSIHAGCNPSLLCCLLDSSGCGHAVARPMLHSSCSRTAKTGSPV